MRRLFFFSFLLLSIAIAAPQGAMAQLANPDFEDTTAGTDMTSGTVISRGGWLMPAYGYSLTSGAQSGMYSATVWNWYYYILGFAVNGTTGIPAAGTDIAEVGAPMTTKPSTLSGYYRFVPGDNEGGASGAPDSAVALVMAKRWNATLARRDTVAIGRLALPPAAAYTPFTLSIADLMPGTDPDSVAVGFWSCNKGIGSCFCGGAGQCLYLTVDNLSLSTPSGIAPVPTGRAVQVWPSPATAGIQVDLSALPAAPATITLTDALGRTVLVQSAAGGAVASIARGDLPAGVYALRVACGGRAVHAQAVVLE